MTTTHTPTPISTRIKVIAENLGWTDNSRYGDTDYGLSQEFEQGKNMVRIEWGPDGRHGVSNELLGVGVINFKSSLGKTIYHVEGRDQATMRAAVITALTEYAELPTGPEFPG
jgi:hypothetical protein